MRSLTIGWLLAFSIAAAAPVYAQMAATPEKETLPSLKPGYSYKAPNGVSYRDRMRPGGPLMVYIETGVAAGVWAELQDYMRSDLPQKPASSSILENRGYLKY